MKFQMLDEVPADEFIEDLDGKLRIGILVRDINHIAAPWSRCVQSEQDGTSSGSFADLSLLSRQEPLSADRLGHLLGQVPAGKDLDFGIHKAIAVRASRRLRL